MKTVIFFKQIFKDKWLQTGSLIFRFFLHVPEHGHVAVQCVGLYISTDWYFQLIFCPLRYRSYIVYLCAFFPFYLFCIRGLYSELYRLAISWFSKVSKLRNYVAIFSSLCVITYRYTRFILFSTFRSNNYHHFLRGYYEPSSRNDIEKF